MSVEDTTITVIGNITADPELKFSQVGLAVAGFTVASSRRVLDRASGRWVDGDTLFLRCSAFRQLAENVAESLTKGTRVVVTGRLRQRSYEDREGAKRTVFEVEVEDAGPSLKWATAKVSKLQRGRAAQGGDASPVEQAGGFSPMSLRSEQRAGLRSAPHLVGAEGEVVDAGAAPARAGSPAGGPAARRAAGRRGSRTARMGRSTTHAGRAQVLSLTDPQETARIVPGRT